MVETNGCRGDKPHLAVSQQRLVTTGTGADYQGIGIPHVSSTDRGATKGNYLVGKLP